MFTSARDSNAALYRCRVTASGWSTPQRVVDTLLLDPRADNGALALAIPREAQLGRLTDGEMKRIFRGGTMPGVLVTGKRPGTVTDADLAAVRVRWNDGALTPDAGIIENIHIAKDGAAPRLDDSIESEPLNSTWWDSQAALAPDGSFVIFASARPDGVGGADLWIADRLSNGRYGTARNLGSDVNSDANDFSPFLAQDGQTLFFASTRSGGMGGSDIYRTHRDAEGEWSEPENLGEAINTEANEAFFFALGRERCIVASDRPGGTGGFDLYEGHPNIFAPGYSHLSVKLLDTTAGRWLRGEAKIIETSLDHAVANLDVTTEESDPVDLPGGFSYRVEVRTERDSTARVITGVIPSDTSMTLEFRFGSPPPPPEVTLSIEGVNLPLYVSGYYRLNTPASLDNLRSRQEERGDLRPATYIANVVGDSTYTYYKDRAAEVEREIGRFVARAINEIFPIYRKVRKPGEYLEISVIGYADPRPIIGSYREEPKVFYDSLGAEVTVKRGQRLTNYLLAGLRAIYAVEELDRRFRASSGSGNDDYGQLIAEGALRWRPLSGNVDAGSTMGDLSQQRRIVVVLRRVEP